MINLLLLFGLLSALSWGAADFTGGFVSKRSDAYTVALVVAAFGVVALGALGIAMDESLPTAQGWLWALSAGAAGVWGSVSLYRALAKGTMGVVAPLTAVIGSLLPVFFGLLMEGSGTLLQLMGMLIAVMAIWLLTGGSVAALRHGDFGASLHAGIGYGLFYILITQAGGEAVFLPSAISHLGALLLLLPIIIIQRKPLLPPRPLLAKVSLCALFDSGGVVLFLLAAQAGRADMATMLSAFAPGVTLLLAWWGLRERLTRPQWAGALGALVAIPMIAW